MRIAVFGGSFDPPHIGHEAIVHEACKTLDIDKLFVVPTFLNPFKETSLITAKQRLFLIKKLFCDTSNIEVCDYEVNQQKAVNTIDTIKYLKQVFNTSKIYLIVGADNYKSIHTWTQYETLKQMVEFVVANRNCTPQTFNNTTVLDVQVEISSTTLRQTLNIDYIPKTIQNDVKQIWHTKKAY